MVVNIVYKSNRIWTGIHRYKLQKKPINHVSDDCLEGHNRIFGYVRYTSIANACVRDA